MNNQSVLTHESYPYANRQISLKCFRKDSCELLQEVLMQKSKIESENEKLREIFDTATVEFEKRNTRISELEAELKDTTEFFLDSEKEKKLLNEQLEKEKGKLRILNKMLFGKSSEKQTSELNDTAENESIPFESEETTRGCYVVKKTNRGAIKGHKGHGRKIPDNLPVEEKIIDLPEDKKHCEICGIPFIETGMEEVSSEISVRKFYYVKRTIRKKYKRGCNCGSKIISAPLPSKLIPKGKFSIEFWVECLINKYMKHLPVTRQIFEIKLYGIHVGSGTIIGGFKTIYSSFIEPLYYAMEKELRKSEHWHADETGWHVFIEIEGKDNYNWFMWGYISENIVLFVLDPTRSAKVPYKVLFDMNEEDIKNLKDKFLSNNNSQSEKILNADKYLGYKALQNQGLIRIAYCWSHERREFTDLLTKYPEDEQLKTWINTWIKKIAELYKVNNERIKHKQVSSVFAEYQKELSTIIDWMKPETEKEYKHKGQIEVMNSMKEHWAGLTLFVNHPEVPMDNNLSERMLRPVVLGRNNYWGNHSIWGGNLTAAMHSIVQTCLLHGISPMAYLIYYFEECAKRGSAPDENEIESFLPHKLSQEIKQKLSIPETKMLDDT